MLRNLIIIFTIAIVSAHISQAQPYHEPTYEQLLQAADDCYEKNFYSNAIDLYRMCYRESRNDTLLYRIAKLQYMLRDYERAQRYYKRIFRSTEPKDIGDYEVLFYYARTMRTLGDYNMAYNIYSSFLEFSQNDSLKQLAQNDIDGMIAASKYEKRYDLYVTPLDEPVNSPFSEYAPEEGPSGGLFWTSFDRSTTIKFDEDGKSSKGKGSSDNEDWYAHITRSSKGKDGKWLEPKKLNEKVNRPGIHTTNNSITPDGDYMYLNREIISGHEVVKAVILVSRNGGDAWEAPREIESVNGEWLALYPTYGELYGEEVLFFASDMPGSMGGLDLYYAPKEGDHFGAPVNLGETINSIGDERTPYYVNGTLYFSSDGHPGMGGLDIFSSTWDGDNWSTPKNMELAYNSRYDDYYFKTDAEGKKGYLVSNRPNKKMRSLKSETCCDDIYKVGIREIEINVLTSVFAEHKPLLDAVVEVVELVDGKLTDNSVSIHSPKGNTYRFPLQADKTYRIYASKDGYSIDSTMLSTMDVVHSYTYKKQFHLKRTEPETRIITINQPIRLHNIYYAFDDAEILPESKASLNKIYNLMTKYDNMVIELSAHTDSRGNDAYNQRLSQRRAESAKDYLVNKGISPDRIVAKGYGETQILNGCVNGVDCTEEQHKFNRRTEFKIIKGPKTIEVKKEIIEGKHHKKKKGKLDIPTEGTHGAIFLNPPEKHYLEPPELYFHKVFHDFGIVNAGSIERACLEFTNTGGQALKIRFVAADECTQLQWPQGPILPGETASIYVTFNSTDITGEKEITVDVLANTVPIVSEARLRAFVSPR